MGYGVVRWVYFVVEVHSAGKYIREVVFLGRQWFRVSNGSGKTFRVHG